VNQQIETPDQVIERKRTRQAQIDAEKQLRLQEQMAVLYGLCRNKIEEEFDGTADVVVSTCDFQENKVSFQDNEFSDDVIAAVTLALTQAEWRVERDPSKKILKIGKKHSVPLAAPVIAAVVNRPAEVRPTAIEQAKTIVGKYTGAWQLYGLDTYGGDTVLKATWDDEVEAKDPVQQGNRAFVTVSNRMNFSQWCAPPSGSSISLDFTEGFFVEEDGSAGERYFDMYGQTTVETQVSPGLFSFETAVSSQELTSLGFADAKAVLSAKHLVVKSVTHAEGVETEWVTRVTTIEWKDPAGATQGKQFVSLKGFHKRIR